MSSLQQWTVRALAAAAVVAVGSGAASAQPAGGIRPANNRPATTRAAGGVMFFPSINTSPYRPGGPLDPAKAWALANNPFANYPVYAPTFITPITPVGFNPVVNPWAVNPWWVNPAVVPATPPVAVKQPGAFIPRGVDTQVNPWSGAVYKPYTGVVVQPDGSTFYRVPGTANPFTSDPGVFYNPNAGTYFNPASGVILRPGTPAFLPYQW